jgi:uncharacterized SAM-binding protein YcdF (DUF218 family)
VRAASKAARRKPLRRKPKRFRRLRWMFRILMWLLLAGIVWCGYVLWLINGFPVSQTAEKKADAGIVLGAALWNDKPSPGLKERLDHAYSLYKQGQIKRFIVTGGLDHNGSRLTEAQGMRDYLTGKGVPVKAILLEDKATSTYENLLLSQAIAKKEAIGSIVIITHSYHAARAKEIADYLGMKHTTLSPVRTQVLNIPYNVSREVLAFTKWKLDSVLLRLGLSLP